MSVFEMGREMDPLTLDNILNIPVDFAGGPTGYISVGSVAEEPAVYAYMPLRGGPHLKLYEALQKQGQAEVSVGLKSGPIIMVATALSTRSITLAVSETIPRPHGLAAGDFVVPDDFGDPLPEEIQ